MNPTATAIAIDAKAISIGWATPPAHDLETKTSMEQLVEWGYAESKGTLENGGPRFIRLLIPVAYIVESLNPSEDEEPPEVTAEDIALQNIHLF
jgi:hypothetical protein